MAERARVRRRQIAYGTYDRRRVDVAPVRDHLNMLRNAGLGVKYIEKATGISHVTLAGIIWGRPTRDGRWVPSRMVTASHAERILQLQPSLDLFADGAFVDARGTIRRLQALVAIGWSLAEIARRLGLIDRNVQRLLHEKRVTASTAKKISAIYEQLWNAQPPTHTPTARAMVARAKARAKAAGWVPPLAWDDIDTDPAPPDSAVDELEQEPADRVDGPDADDLYVDEIAVALAVRGEQVNLTREERHLAVTTLNRYRGYDDPTIAKMLGVSDKTIARDREYLHLPAAVGPDRQRIAS